MSLQDVFMITSSPAVSVVLWIVIVVTLLYFARSQAHHFMEAAARFLHGIFRVGARAMFRAETRMAERNREVLLAAGAEAKARVIEREFSRIDETVQRDLAGYPGLHRNLSESIARLEEDHQGAVDVPPDPPGWTTAIQAVAELDARSNPMLKDVMEDIHASLQKAHAQAMTAYREASGERHKLLRGMMPHWRRIQQTLQGVGRSVDSLLERSKTIDRHMQEYEEMVKGTDRAASVLYSSSLVQFFVSALVLAVAVGGATVNFSLIARPMAEMVGGTSFIGNLRTADIAALVIIMVEISMGLFLMESLRITRLFPVIGALSEKVRKRMVWITFTILFVLASVEAGLAYMREILMQDELATSAALRSGAAVIENEFLWITTAAQMAMGFILPFALVFVAIPLETFVHSLRTVMGLIGLAILRTLAVTLRMLGQLCKQSGTLLKRIYDLPIFIPLWIEDALRDRGDDTPVEAPPLFKEAA